MDVQGAVYLYVIVCDGVDGIRVRVRCVRVQREGGMCGCAEYYVHTYVGENYFVRGCSLPERAGTYSQMQPLSIRLRVIRMYVCLHIVIINIIIVILCI